MITAPRFIRTVGVFALGLAALVAASGQASANCTLSFSPSQGTAGQTLTITKIAGDLTGTSSVTIGGNSATIQSVTSTTVQVTIPSEPTPTVTSVVTTSFPGGRNWGSTTGGDTLQINGTNFNPTVSVTINGSNSCDGT
jgi:IPT/TIG domain